MALDSNAIFLIACISETLGYGIALVLFISSTQTLLKKRKYNENLNLPIFLASPILFFFSTLHVIGVWVRTYKAFVSYPQGPLVYWGLITSPEKTVTQVGQVGAVILADLMTVYRTLMIWNLKYRIIIVPTVTFIATIVGAAGFITAQHRVNVHTSIFSTTVTQWTEAWLACSLVTTGICTIAIIYKLLSVQRKLGQSAAYSSSRSLTTRVLWIFVESAALYTINNLLYAVLYSVKISEEAWFSGLDAPVASITFSLIIVRVESAVNAPPTRISRTRHTATGSAGSGSFLPPGVKPPTSLLESRYYNGNLNNSAFNSDALKTLPSNTTDTRTDANRNSAAYYDEEFGPETNRPATGQSRNGGEYAWPGTGQATTHSTPEVSNWAEVSNWGSEAGARPHHAEDIQLEVRSPVYKQSEA